MPVIDSRHSEPPLVIASAARAIQGAWIATAYGLAMTNRRDMDNSHMLGHNWIERMGEAYKPAKECAMIKNVGGTEIKSAASLRIINDG